MLRALNGVNSGLTKQVVQTSHRPAEMQRHERGAQDHIHSSAHPGPQPVCPQPLLVWSPAHSDDKGSEQSPSPFAKPR